MLSLIARIIPHAIEPRNPWTPKINGTQVEKYALFWAIFSSILLKTGCKSPAIIPKRIAYIGVKINGALVPIIAAPAKTPYIRSLILILPWITALRAREVTTHVEMAQYAAIIPFSAKKGVVLTEGVDPIKGTSKKIHG